MNVAINGLGRIGRAVFKILMANPEVKVAAINDVTPPDNLAYLLNHDTVYGRYANRVTVVDHSLMVADRSYRVITEPDASRLPWGRLKVDLVFECTGRYNRRLDLAKHLEAGAKRVILSAPPKDDDIPTVVFAVNAYDEKDGPILSCASCTTNCVAPVVEIMGRRLGMKKAVMNTVHAYTATQALVDGPHRHMRRGRAGAANLVPSTTGAGTATARLACASRTVSRHSRQGARPDLFIVRYRYADGAPNLGRRSQRDLSSGGEERTVCRRRRCDGGPCRLDGHHSRFPRIGH